MICPIIESMQRLFAFLAVSGLAMAQAGHSVTVADTDSLNPAGTTYNIWRASGSCPSLAPTSTPPAGFTLLTATPIAGTGSAPIAISYVDSAVTGGNTYAYVITAVTPNGQSVPSPCSQVTAPAGFPVPAPTLTAK